MCQAKIRETRSFHLLPLGRNLPKYEANDFAESKNSKKSFPGSGFSFQIFGIGEKNRGRRRESMWHHFEAWWKIGSQQFTESGFISFLVKLPSPPCPRASVRTSEDRKLPIYFPVLLWSLCQGSASQFSSRLFENFPCSLYKTSHKLKP